MSIKGIDVSYFQGDIDWQKVSKSGIEFAIPRIGYGKGTVDSKFRTYVSGALSAGIKIPGAYYFSYALSVEDAKREGEFAAKTCREAGLPDTTIIFFDLEYDSVRYAKDCNVVIDADLCIAMTAAFCKAVENAGYKSGVYANVDYYDNYYKRGRGIPEGATFWLAYWNGSPTVPCLFHQTSEKGRVSGIKGNVDLDTFFGVEFDEPVKLKGPNSKIVKDVINGKYGNGEERKKKLREAGYDYYLVQEAVNKRVDELAKEQAEKNSEPTPELPPVTEPVATKEVTAALVLDIIAGKYGNGEERKKKLTEAGYNYDDAQSKVNDYLKNKPAVAAAKSFDNSITGKYKVNAVGLNCRYVPGLLTFNNVEKILGQGDVVQSWGYYTQIGNSKWYLIQQGKLIGWVDSKYLVRI